ncbi:MAG: HAD-IA family hydrolase [Candidatus Microthrix sp.]|nr:HAD-IA family hydrolase [Candidatus Microthrix sp.]
MAIEAVVFDLDGVVRHFDRDHLAEVERAHGLAPGELIQVAFERDLLNEVTTGRITRAEWGERVGEQLASQPAARAWLSDRGEVDRDLLEVIDAVRSGGLTVALLTNGTDTISDEMVDLGLIGHFDRIFNSAKIGIAKPARAVYEYVCGELAVEPGNVFFTDDSPSHVAGALELGMIARRYEGLETLKLDLRTEGIEL